MKKENNNVLAQFVIKLRQYIIRWWQFMTRRIILLEKTKRPTEVLVDGTKVWKNKYGELHREDGLPAKIYNNGRQEWYYNGVFIMQITPKPDESRHVSNYRAYFDYAEKYKFVITEQ